MKSVIKLIVAVLCLVFISSALAASLPTAKPAEVGLSSQRLDLIDGVLKADIENGKIPGAVLLVARNPSSYIQLTKRSNFNILA